MARAPAPSTAAASALAAAVAQDAVAEAGRLVYADDTQPGFRRVRSGRGFAYRQADGRPLTDPDALRRIRHLAIPPAYGDVWICPLAEGHIQATGRDAKGRKQYRYHPLWQALAGAHKFERLREFGLALPLIRRAVERDLALPGLPRRKVLSTLVRLLDTTYLRVGNDEYARSNGSYGLTTLRNRHAAVKGGQLTLSFRGKSGVQQEVALADPQVARIVRRLQELPGQELFQFIDDDGTPHSIDSGDVNAHLRELAQGDFTAKDFRTWHASALALAHLHPCTAETAAEAQRRIKDVIGQVARQLGHTLAVCRKSYVHPDVLSRFAAGELQAVCDPQRRGVPRLRGLKDSERRLLALLQPPRGVSRRRQATALVTAALASG